MFHILIVEDDQNTLKQLRTILSQEFPESQVDTSETVKEGLDFIRRASERHWPYDAAILDFKLPQNTGENAEVDKSLCHVIEAEMPGTLIAHITAYSNDNIVEEHLKKAHLERTGPRGFTLSKTEINWNWVRQLVKQTKAYLYGTRIEAQMASLFGDHIMGVAAESRGRGRTGGRGGSITHPLAALCRDIVAHWNDIDEMLKDKIRSIFNVDEARDPIRISLL